MNSWFFKFTGEIEELQAEVTELRDATGGLVELEERLTAVEKGIEKAMSRTGAEGTGKR